MDNLQQTIIALKREIRDLKTAQITPSVLKTYYKTVTIPSGTYDGVYTWTVQFADQDTSNTPIFLTSFDISVLPFESDNTLKLEWQTLETTFFISVSFKVYSSKPIASITPDF